MDSAKRRSRSARIDRLLEAAALRSHATVGQVPIDGGA